MSDSQVGSQLRSQLDSADDVIAGARQLLDDGALDLPVPGAGDTASRFDALAEIAATDLSLARICEGHTDAIAILHEADRTPSRGLYGVWAADASDHRVTAHRSANGWRLHGSKRYASGALRLDRALVTARDGARGMLFELDLATAGVRPVPGTWQAVGMAATDSLDVVLDDVVVGDPVGSIDFYLQRPGFWYGAVGVAACWYGGALGAFRMLRGQLQRRGASEHQRAHLGAVAASCDAMRAVLHAAAAEIDRHVLDRKGALVARQVVEQQCQDVIVRVGRASGSSALVFDREHARRIPDLVVYLRQHHAEHDLAQLGEIVLASS